MLGVRKLQRASPPGIFVPVRGGLTHTLETSDTPTQQDAAGDGSILATSQDQAQSRTPFTPRHW